MTKKKRNIIIIIAAVIAAIGITLAIVLPLTLNKDNGPYVVTFDSNGGSAVASITDVKHNSLITKPADPTKLNHRFDGWHKDDRLTKSWNFETDKVTSNITLYAKWTYDETIGLNMMRNGNEYTVAGIGNVTDENILIPETYEGLPVTTIAQGAFKGQTSIKTVFIPSNVKTIKSEAFSGCSELTEVVLPDTLTTIESNLFYLCAKLANVNIPDSVTSIEYQAFSGCKSLTEVKLPAKLNELGEKAFSNCIGIERLTVDSDNSKYVSRVGGSERNCVIEVAAENKVVVGCKNSDIPVVAGRDTVIGQSAFYGCSELKSIAIPYGVIEIENDAFNGCNGLTQVTIPASVTRIGDYAFSSCSELSAVTFSPLADSDPDSPEYGIKELGKEAFSYCNLSGFHLPKSLTSIGRGLFYDIFPPTMTITCDHTANNLRNIIDKADDEEKDYYVNELRVRCFDTSGEGVLISGLA